VGRLAGGVVRLKLCRTQRCGIPRIRLAGGVRIALVHARLMVLGIKAMPYRSNLERYGGVSRHRGRVKLEPIAHADEFSARLGDELHKPISNCRATRASGEDPQDVGGWQSPIGNPQAVITIGQDTADGRAPSQSAGVFAVRIDHDDVRCSPPTSHEALQQRRDCARLPSSCGADDRGVSHDEPRSVKADRNFFRRREPTQTEMLVTGSRKHSAQLVGRSEMDSIIQAGVGAHAALEPTRAPVDLAEQLDL